MRMLWALAVAALGALGLQDTAPRQRIVVVVDTDAPAADPADAARLRDEVLQTVDGRLPVSYYELTAEGLTAIPEAEGASFRRTRFTITPPSYSGVSPTFAEGVEVLRGNEFVRSSLIERGCDVGNCAGVVRAAVEAEVRRTERASAGKLRDLAAQAATWRDATVVLFTSGWPTRDEGRVALDARVRELRRAELSLLVLRVPPPTPYRGLVRDAAEALAAELPAGFVTLDGDAAVKTAAGRLAGALPSAGTLHARDEAEASSSRSSDAIERAAPDPAASAVTRDEPTLVAPRASPAAPDPAGMPAADALLDRAATYVERFERTFTSVLWHERYEQEARAFRRFGSSGVRASTIAERRLLEAELFFAWLPNDGTWISVRDVTAVDGQPRPATERRLPPLSARSTVSLLELRDLAAENGRFNLGTMVRTFNEPTLALLFLDRRHLAGIRIVDRTRHERDGRRVVTYRFVERQRPTLIRNGNRDMPVGGAFTVDEATGAVWHTRLELASPVGGLTGQMVVDYQPHVDFDVLVPREMRETYTSSDEQIDAVAIYSEFRRFQTSGRLILTP